VSDESSIFKLRPRIQSLSDLIFGLALSISALTLISQQPATTQQLMASIGLYGFSFLILISVWRLYSSITSILPTETLGLTDLNIVLLFTVSIEPYLFNELFALKGAMFYNVSNIYALDLAAMFLILAFFHHSLANEEKKLVPKSLLGRYRLGRNMSLSITAVFIVSTTHFRIHHSPSCHGWRNNIRFHPQRSLVGSRPALGLEQTLLRTYYKIARMYVSKFPFCF
jgi:uncharacterized membrane protein